MIPRLLAHKLHQLSEKMPVICLTGPRQSGKTMLVKNVFKGYKYINLEQLEVRQFALQDPLGFLKSLPQGVIIDEAQYVPEIFSYIQVAVDESRRNGEFILTGSQNFQLSAHISQSLAGRTANLYLLPFSTEELNQVGLLSSEYELMLVKGAYPRIYDQNIEPGDFYPSYIESYVERDVRQLLNVSDLGKFQIFIRLCASRIGQQLNLSSISIEAGVDANTVKRWFSILESSFIAFKLQPYFKNYNKRLTKTPKIFFYDTGLVCSLLGIRTTEQLENHYLKGVLFENFIQIETLKQYYNRGIRPMTYYWRDHVGLEIDLIIDEGGKIIPVEIKSGRTIQLDFFTNLGIFNKISGSQPEKSHIIYGGEEHQVRSQGTVSGWKRMPQWVDQV